MDVDKLQQDILNGVSDEILCKYPSSVMIQLCKNLKIASSSTSKQKFLERLKKKLFEINIYPNNEKVNENILNPETGRYVDKNGKIINP